MRYGNPQPEAPTHLGSHQLPLPPEWLPAEDFDDDDDDGPTRAARARSGGWTPVPPNDVSISGPTRQPTERSASPLLLENRRLGVERPHPDDVRREARRSSRDVVRVADPTAAGHSRAARSVKPPATDEERRSFVASGEVHTAPPKSRIEVPREIPPVRRSSKSSKSEKRDDRRDSRRAAKIEERVSAPSASAPSASASEPSQPSASARGSQPEIDPALLKAAAAAQAVQAQQAAALQAMGAIDPLAVAVPPELAGPVYSWIRRLALQADLLGADKVLREAFTDLTSSLSVAIVYPGADGLWTLGNDDEIPKEATPLVAVAQARRAMIAPHTALIPVVTSSETVAVIMLTRNPRNPGFHPVEQIAAIALARESAAILHHLAVAHLQKASEIKADQGGLYRGEALEAHRTRGNEGVPVNLSPGWIRRAYPFLVVAILVAIVLSIVIKVPTYSSGVGVVVLPGVAVAAPSGGNVEAVLVKPGQHVKKGTVLLRLNTGEQDAELRSAQSDADNLTYSYLFDAQDEQVKKTLGNALVKVKRELERVDGRLVRATAEGTVSDLRVRVGSAIAPGDQVLQIVDPKAEPEMWAFLPGKDRPRLRPSVHKLQVDIIGYMKSRAHAPIISVSTEVISAAEVAKILGPQLADSIKLPPGSYVWVKAKLPKKFKTQHNTFFYHHGMPAKTEVKIQTKPFIVTLLPALEKYIPD